VKGRDQGSGVREQGSEDREQRTENREQRRQIRFADACKSRNKKVEFVI